MKKYWFGKTPKKCDLCGRPITNNFVDGRTRQGPFAIMCLLCHATAGVGLGLGKGQLFKKDQEGFVKIEG